MATGWEDVPSDGWEDITAGDGWEDLPSNPAPDAPVLQGEASLDDVVTVLGGANKKTTKPAETIPTFAGIELDPVAIDAIKKAWDERTQGMGISDETRRVLGGNGPVEALRPITDIPSDVADIVVRGIEGLGAVGGAAVAGLTAGIGEDFGVEDRDRMAGSAAELFDIGSLFAGGQAPSVAAANRARILQEAFDAGATAEDLLKVAPDLDRAALKAAYDAKADNKPVRFVPDEAAVERALQNEADTFTLKKNIEAAEQPLAQEAAAFKPKPEPKVEDVFPTAESRAAKEAALEEKLKAEAESFLNKDKVEEAPVKVDTDEAPKDIDPEYSKALDEHVSAISDNVARQTESWTNRPEIKTVRTVDDLPDNLREKVKAEGEDAKGVIGDDGKVHIIAENIERPEDATGVVFHEALGHHGLTQRFGQKLDSLFDRFYDTNSAFRSEVDDWLRSNPSAYSDLEASTRRRIAADEVLAERSELGPVEARFWDVLKNNIKDFARRAGIKLAYSDREIDTILGMAHDAVINGYKSVADNGFRLSRGDGRKFRPKISMTQASMETRNPVDEVSDFLRDRVKEYSGASVSDVELNRMAKDTGLTGSQYIKNRSLRDQQVAAKVRAAHQILTNQMDELAGLGEKARTEGMTPSLYADIQERLRTVEAVYAKFDEDTSELGRALRALKQASESKKSAQAALRFMKEAEGSGDLLTNPVTVEEFLNSLNAKSNELSKAEQAQLVREAKKTTLSDKIASVLNIPRSIKSSLDLSAPLRQGIGLIHKKEWWKAWGPMLRSAVSKKAYEEIMSEIRSRPSYGMMRKAGLGLTDVEGPLSAREEAFMSNVTKHIPGVAGSERAYNAFLNRLRADTFDSLAKTMESAGIPLMEKQPPSATGAARPAKPSAQLRGVAKFINTATGRGDFKAVEGAGPLINAILFSPRFIKSRFDILNPVYYAKLPPVARKEALKSALAIATYSATIAGLFAMNGADVETDMRSSDFNKMKIGNVRYDAGAGLNQWLTLYKRLYSNETKSLKGNVRKIGEGYGADSWGETLYKFFRNKASPNANFVLEYKEGKDAVGNEVTKEQALANLVKPMFASDYYELVGEKGLAEGTLFAAPVSFGWGMQNFDENKPKETK